jgi:hypothetical protein
MERCTTGDGVMITPNLKNGLVYDIELYRNLFMVSFYHLNNDTYSTFAIYPDGEIDQRDDLFNLVRNATLVGYNNWNYDDGVLRHLLYNKGIDVEELWKWSQTLINGGRNPYRYPKEDPVFYSYDISELVRVGKTPKKLKLVGCNLKHNKLQDLPIEFDKPVERKEFELMRDYNRNDVLITKKVLDFLKPELDMREILTKEYGVDVRSVSKTGIAKAYLTKEYAKKAKDPFFKEKRTKRGNLNMSDLFYPHIEFITEDCREFFNYVKTLTLKAKPTKDGFTTYEWNMKFRSKGLVLSIGLGGIHSVDDPAIYVEDDDWCILDLDVTSQYPAAIVNNKLCPEHLEPDVFLPLFQGVINDRVKNKKLYKETGEHKYKVFQEGLKVCINSVYGLLKSEYCWLYDPKILYTVTLNNQFLMLMLIELFEVNGYEVISANTDGVTLHIKRTELENVRNLYKTWEKSSKFQLEETFYKKLYRRDINNYLTVLNLPIVDDKDIKSKGIFLPQSKKELKDGYHYPIMSIALLDYFLNGVPIEDTVKTHWDIYDFTRCEKTSKQFTNYLQCVKREYKTHWGKDFTKQYVTPKIEDTLLSEQQIQDSVRFYVAKPSINPLDKPGYADYCEIGYSLKKKKMRDGARYEVVPLPDGQKGFQIRDLVNDVLLDEVYRTKTLATKDCQILNKSNDQETVQVEQVSDYVAGKFVKLFNDYFDAEDYEIDYDFYIDEINKIINKIENG